MNDHFKSAQHREIVKLSRRSIITGGVGLGALALFQLSSAADKSAGRVLAAPAPKTDQGVLGTGQFPAKAKRVLHIMMWGGLSQCDTFDYKPTLVKMHGKEIPSSIKDKGGRVSTMSGAQSSFPCIAPVTSFRQYGESGAWVSDLLPHMGGVIDEFTVVRSMYTEHVNHDPAAKFLHTGFQLSGRPSAGAWVNYALGSDNANLPSFVAMYSGGQGGVGVDASAWGAGFLPSHHQGVLFGDGTDPVLYVSSPEGIDRQARRTQLDVLRKIADVQTSLSNDPEIASKLTQYEMAFRMQDSVPDAVDISKEPKSVLESYGPDVAAPGSFGRNCILARRLLERDVKFVQLMHTGWDAHSFLQRSIAYSCQQIDQPMAALISDLRQRGLLEDTLVIISTEFGRTPFAQGAFDSTSYGRDHHGPCFTYLVGGAGVKKGHVHGETDDFSYNVVRDPVHIHDMQATMMHLLGIDHELLTYHYQGRDFRLTDVAGKVVKGILA